MKTKLLTLLALFNIALHAPPLHAAAAPDVPRSTLNGPRWSAQPFVAYQMTSLDKLDGAFAYGLAGQYRFDKHLAIEGDFLTCDDGGQFIDRAGLRLVPTLPLGKTGFSLYGLLGADPVFGLKGLEYQPTWFMRSGGGLAFDGPTFGGGARLGIGADLSWLENFAGRAGSFEPRVFFRFSF